MVNIGFFFRTNFVNFYLVLEIMYQKEQKVKIKEKIKQYSSYCLERKTK